MWLGAFDTEQWTLKVSLVGTSGGFSCLEHQICTFELYLDWLQ